ALGAVVALGGRVDVPVAVHGDALGVGARGAGVGGVLLEADALALLPAFDAGRGAVGVRLQLPQPALAVVDAPQEDGVLGDLHVQARAVLEEGGLGVERAHLLRARPRGDRDLARADVRGALGRLGGHAEGAGDVGAAPPGDGRVPVAPGGL